MDKIYKALDESTKFQQVLYNILQDNLEEDECVDTILQDSLTDIAEAIESNRHRGSMWDSYK